MFSNPHGQSHLLGWGWVADKGRWQSSWVPFLAPHWPPPPHPHPELLSRWAPFGVGGQAGACESQKQVWEKGAIVAEPRGLRATKWMCRADAIDGMFPGGVDAAAGAVPRLPAGPNPLGAAMGSRLPLTVLGCWWGSVSTWPSVRRWCVSVGHTKDRRPRALGAAATPCVRLKFRAYLDGGWELGAATRTTQRS